MNLLAFVLLGFLAHSCSGTVQIRHANFQQHVCSIINDHFSKNEGVSLLPFDLAGISGVVTSVTDLISLQTVITYQSSNKYQLDIKGAVKLNSLHFTGLELRVHVTGQLGLFVRKGCLNLNVIEGSLQVTLEVANKAVSVGLGGILGNALNLVNGFTSTSQLLLKAKLQEVIRTALVALNTGFQGITSSVHLYGKSFSYQVTAIEYTLESFVVSLELIVKGSADTVTKALILATKEVTELPESLVSTICVSADFINGLLDCLLDDVVTGVQMTLTNVQWQLQSLYQSFEDKVSLSVTKASAPSSDIKSSGSSFWLTFGVSIIDATGDAFLETKVDVTVNIAATANNGLLALSLGRTSISNSRVSGKGGRFASKADAELLGSTTNLLEDTIDNIVQYLQCALDSGMPSIAPMISYLPFVSKCSPLNNYNGFQCDCEKK